MQNIFTLLKMILSLVTGGFSNAAPAVNTQDGPTTQSNGPVTLKVERKSMTTDGIFGEIWINGKFVDVDTENKEKAIAEGLYDAIIDYSPRLGYKCPHIRVPDRDLAAGGDAGIRIHILNSPCESEGCIGPGTCRDGDAVDNSKTAFNKMMSLLPPPGTPFKVLIYSIH